MEWDVVLGWTLHSLDLVLDLGQVPTRRVNLSGYGYNMDRHTSLCWLKASDLAIQAKQPWITASCPRAGHTTHSPITSHVLIDLLHVIHSVQHSTHPYLAYWSGRNSSAERRGKQQEASHLVVYDPFH